jgi:1-acyl-sn-glycerol-3-phosphate acyltransferase
MPPAMPEAPLESVSSDTADRPGVSATLLAAVRSAATYVGVAAYVALAAPPGLLVAFGFRRNGILYDLGHVGVRLGLALSGIRVRVSGLERAPGDRAVVFCANHQSNVDPPILFTTLHRRLHILFKAELLKLPLLGRVFVAGGFIPVERADRERALASIADGARSIREGHSFLIFPEGTRSRTSRMLPFKKGGFIMAIEAQAPVVPVAITGGRTAMRKGSRLVWPARVTVQVGEPIDTRGMTLADRDDLIAETRRRVEALLEPPR